MEAATRRREGEDEIVGQTMSRRVSAAIGFGLLGVAALALTVSSAAQNGGSVSIAASDQGWNGENRNVRESAFMKAHDVVMKDMAKLQADLDRAQSVKDPETGEIRGDDIRQAIADDYARIQRDTEAQAHPDLGTFDHNFFRGDP